MPPRRRVSRLRAPEIEPPTWFAYSSILRKHDASFPVTRYVIFFLAGKMSINTTPCKSHDQTELQTLSGISSRNKSKMRECECALCEASTLWDLVDSPERERENARIVIHRVCIAKRDKLFASRYYEATRFVPPLSFLLQSTQSARFYLYITDEK